MNNYLKASNNPLDDINAIAYEGQNPEMRMYKQGYEDFFEMMPILVDEDPQLRLKLKGSKLIMKGMAEAIRNDEWTASLAPFPGRFNRNILALEPPAIKADGRYKEGAEIVLARWGDGFSSPVHGHADGLLYEQLLFGKMRVNTYRIIDHEKRIVRPVETRIYNGFENIASSYTYKQEHTRSALVHNFTSIGYSASLHYVPEHTRDGRDNGFEVEYFDNYFKFEDCNFEQLNAQEGIQQLHIGDVALVRSENVPEYGDHFIVITGKPILKEHGLRPQGIAIHAPGVSWLFKGSKGFQPIMGLTLLKLDQKATQAFHEFHGIEIKNGNVIFPTA